MAASHTRPQAATRALAALMVPTTRRHFWCWPLTHRCRLSYHWFNLYGLIRAFHNRRRCLVRRGTLHGALCSIFSSGAHMSAVRRKYTHILDAVARGATSHIAPGYRISTSTTASSSTKLNVRHFSLLR